jgi:Protein of unknown function (DUF1501)
MNRPMPGGCPDLVRSMALRRRDVFQIGSVGVMSVGLLSLLAARARAGGSSGSKTRACILLFQVGGPYQCDTFDPKPQAPEEVRGPFKVIATGIPGLEVTDALPQVAAHASKFAVVRSVHHTIRCHNPAIYCTLVGREATTPLAVSVQTEASRTDHPHYASVLSKFRPGTPSMPGHVVIPDLVSNGPARSPGLLGGYLGTNYDPFVLGDPLTADRSPHVDGVGPPEGVDDARTRRRQGLLTQLDTRHRQFEQGGRIESMGALYRRAFDLVTSPRAKQAFDIEREPDRVRDRYGRHAAGRGTLLARRLVEAGVPFVTVFSHTQVDGPSWDTHNNHDDHSKKNLLPPADQSLSALLEDMGASGLLDEVLVIWMGEFGRTPRRGVQFSNNSNNVGGRDHWCNAYSVVLAGGGVQGGRVIGSSDRIGAYPIDRPVHISDLAATIFHAMGVDPKGQFHDLQGRLRFVCDGQPVHELF